MANITYTKQLKTIDITLVSGDPITVSDTDTKPIATNALAEFEAYKTMHIPFTDESGDIPVDGIWLIPFHAVVSIAVVSDSVTVTKGDPYNCVENSEG